MKKITSFFGLFAIVASLLFMVSCQKDSLVSVPTATEVSSVEKTDLITQILSSDAVQNQGQCGNGKMKVEVNIDDLPESVATAIKNGENLSPTQSITLKQELLTKVFGDGCANADISIATEQCQVQEVADERFIELTIIIVTEDTIIIIIIRCGSC